MNLGTSLAVASALAAVGIYSWIKRHSIKLCITTPLLYGAALKNEDSSFTKRFGSFILYFCLSHVLDIPRLYRHISIQSFLSTRVFFWRTNLLPSRLTRSSVEMRTNLTSGQGANVKNINHVQCECKVIPTDMVNGSNTGGPHTAEVDDDDVEYRKHDCGRELGATNMMDETEGGTSRNCTQETQQCAIEGDSHKKDETHESASRDDEPEAQQCGVEGISKFPPMTRWCDVVDDDGVDDECHLYYQQELNHKLTPTDTQPSRRHFQKQVNQRRNAKQPNSSGGAQRQRCWEVNGNPLQHGRFSKRHNPLVHSKAKLTSRPERRHDSFGQESYSWRTVQQKSQGGEPEKHPMVPKYNSTVKLETNGCHRPVLA